VARGLGLGIYWIYWSIVNLVEVNGLFITNTGMFRGLYNYAFVGRPCDVGKPHVEGLPKMYPRQALLE
jgi:hypothetical protein